MEQATINFPTLKIIKESEIKTQKDAVLYHLQTVGHITSWEAIKEYGASRLSGIIFDFRKLGYDIISEDSTAKNRFGNTVTYSTYIYKSNH